MDLPDFLAQDADGFIHLRGHRIGIQHIVHCYDEGYSAEMLAEEFPTLSLALIHKTIGYGARSNGTTRVRRTRSMWSESAIRRIYR